jgi:hypothetical protein
MTRERQRELKRTRRTSLEKWQGNDMIVIRDGFGHFVHNVNLTNLRKVKAYTSR